jgi:hypothetical protein
MQTIRVRSRLGKNGLLQIQLPEATEGTELDVILVYEPASTTIDRAKLRDKFYGCIQDETFVRHPL